MIKQKSNCAFCGKVFEHTHNTARFCGQLCWTRNKRNSVVEKKDCDHCGKTFDKVGKARRFCDTCITTVSEHVRRSSTIDGRVNGLLNGARNRSKTKKLEFNLSHEYLMGLWDKQKGKCALSGRRLTLTRSKISRQVHQDAPSLDRIIPAKGYVKGNVRFLTYHSNVCVNEYGDEMLFKLIEDIRCNKA